MHLTYGFMHKIYTAEQETSYLFDALLFFVKNSAYITHNAT